MGTCIFCEKGLITNLSNSHERVFPLGGNDIGQSMVLSNKEFKNIFGKKILPIIGELLPNTVYRFKKVFRASEHGYEGKKFREFVHGVKNTLLLVKTKNNRIFGAYTPCMWQKDIMYQYQKDQKLRSFLFSLRKQVEHRQSKQTQEQQQQQQNQLTLQDQSSQRQKKPRYYAKTYKILDKSKAIMNHSTTGPIFGQGHDIFISDKCNKNENWCNLGKSYSCANIYGSNRANSQLGGMIKFLIDDYEIWSISWYRE